MIDLSHIPFPSNANVQIYYGGAPFSLGNFQIWNKPRGANFLHIYAIGGGGGGGSAGVPAAAVLGGAGGGSGAQTNLLFNLADLPDILYVQPGAGGAGGVNGTGSVGNISYVTTSANSSGSGILVSAGGGGGGTFGTTVGSAGSIAATSLASLAQIPYGITTSTNSGLAGQAGATSSNTTTTTAASGTGTIATLSFGITGGIYYQPGDTISVTGITPTAYQGIFTVLTCSTNSVTYASTATGAQTVAGTIECYTAQSINLSTTGLMLTGGAAGGRISNTSNRTADGGAIIPITGDTYFPKLLGGLSSQTATGNGADGLDGIKIPNLMYFYGGTGGGAGGWTSGNGGNGGNGAYGCGGGGGGAGKTGSVQSKGGRGGDGFVIMVAF